MRSEKDNIDIDTINEDSNPTAVAKYIADQITSYQEFDEKPEHLNKIMKRLKRMVRTHAHFSPLQYLFPLKLGCFFYVCAFH